MTGKTASDDQARYPEPTKDTTNIEKIWPQLNTEQKRWIEELSADERKTIAGLLWQYGESHFLACFAALKEELQYVRSL